MRAFFHLLRETDVSGVSGTGVVAYGVVTPFGRVFLEWCGEHQSVVIYQRLSEMEAVHLHGGKTKIVWDEATCRGCGHPWRWHVHDNCGGCDGCLCTVGSTERYEQCRPLDPCRDCDRPRDPPKEKRGKKK